MITFIILSLFAAAVYAVYEYLKASATSVTAEVEEGIAQAKSEVASAAATAEKVTETVVADVKAEAKL